MPTPLSDPVPLRSSAAWPKFAKPEPLNTVYGRCVVPLIQYDQTRKTWLAADHAIGGVDAVQRDGRSENVYAWRNATDPTGHPVALVELGTPLAANATLTAALRGKIHPGSGAMIENPADVLVDLLRFAGQDIDVAEVADFRAACARVPIAGMLSPGLTLRAQIAEIAQSVGMLWSPSMRGLARRWPADGRTPGEPIYARLAEPDVSEVRATASQDGLYTVLRVEYDWDWPQNRARRSVTLRADSAAVYGDRETILQAKWLTGTAEAVARGTAWLHAYARPRWAIRLTADLDPSIPPGGWFAVTHPLIPFASELLALDAEWDWSNQRQQVSAECAVGPAPDVMVVNVGGLFAEPASDLRITYAQGVATLVVVDPGGAPIRDAVVTFDAQKAKTDRTGTVRFKTERGAHAVTVEAAGFASSTAEITL